MNLHLPSVHKSNTYAAFLNKTNVSMPQFFMRSEHSNSSLEKDAPTWQINHDSLVYADQKDLSIFYECLTHLNTQPSLVTPFSIFSHIQACQLMGNFLCMAIIHNIHNPALNGLCALYKPSLNQTAEVLPKLYLLEEDHRIGFIAGHIETKLEQTYSLERSLQANELMFINTHLEIFSVFC